MLDLNEFIRMLKFKPEEGMVTFRGNRMLLFNAEALCLLREELIHTLGWEIARGVLTRFGYRCGYNDVISMRNRFDIKSDAEWMLAGPHIHGLEGLVKSVTDELKFDREAGTFLMHGQWLNTYEADQQLALFGTGEHPACWTIAGYASGYGSGFMGKQVLCIETMCRGKGDPYCTWEMRNIEAWGGDKAARHLEELKPKAVVKSMQNMLFGERRLTEQWRALSQASVQITSDIASESRFRSFGNYARTLMFAEHSLIAVYNEQSSGLEVYRSCNERESKKNSYEPRGVLKSLVVYGQPINLTEISAEHYLPPNVRNLLGVPLIAYGRIIGGLIVANKKDGADFSQDDTKLLQILAGQAAVAIENSRLYERTDEKLQQKVAQLKELNAKLFNQNAMIKKSNAIHSQLTDLVLEGRGIDAITASLAQIVSNIVTIEDISFRTISRAGFDSGEREQVQCLSAQDILDNPEMEAQRVILLDERRAVKIPRGKLNGRELSQYLIPIAAGQDILGYVSCLDVNRQLEELDQMALEQAGTVYALELLKQKVAFETELRIKEDFLGELLSGSYQTEEQVLEQAAKLGFNLKTGYVVTLLDLKPKVAGTGDTEFGQRFLGLVRQETNGYSSQSIVVHKNKQILILLALSKKGDYLDNLNNFVSHLTERLLKNNSHVIWRLAAGTPCHMVSDFSRSYEEALFALDVMLNINRHNTFTAYDQLRVFGMLEINKKSFAAFIRKVIGPLLDYDIQHHSQLIDTLNLYYRCNGNVQLAARQGYLNPSTLKYRLKRIQEIAALELNDPDTSLQVQLALKLLT